MDAANPTTTPKAPANFDFVDPAEAPLAQCVQYVLDRFHVFERAEMERLPGVFRKAVAEQGAAHPELARAQRVFADLVAELFGHFDKEEQILLPYIVSLDPSRGRGSFRAPFGNVAGPVRVMEMEHDAAKEAMAQIEALTKDLTVPSGASAITRELYEGLRVFIDDMRAHIDYEDVLFPRAIEVEAAAH